MAVRNYFSGCEGAQHFQAAVDAKAQHVLVSFLYIQKQKGNVLRKRKKRNPNIKFMVDSGAHTFQTQVNDPASQYYFKKWGLQDYENYIEAYAEYLLKYKDYIECAVELDIDYCLNMVAGQDKFAEYGSKIVQKWQDKYFRPLEAKGIQIIYVWHEQRGMIGWEEMCSKFSYCGLPGEFSSNADFNTYITVARRYTTFVHGFAATKQADFRDWPWYSIDSTTWKSSEMYGTLIHWDSHGEKLRFIQDKALRVNYRRQMEKYGLDADAIIQEKPGHYKLLTKYALISMVLMEEFYVRKYATRIFYYQLRLPHPRIVAAWSQREADIFWGAMRCEDVLEKDRAKKGTARKDILYWVSLIQHRDDAIFNMQPALDFLNQYFEEFLKNSVANIQGLQKEVSELFAPPNPPPLARVDKEHYIPTNHPPKAREVVTLTAEELEWRVTDELPAQDF